MHFSAFTSYMSENKGRIPAATYSQIRREGIARIQERFAAGRADCELSFSDLIERAENAVMGR